jgi:general stress protein 26
MSDAHKLKEQLWKKMTDGPFVMVGLKDGGHSEPLTVQLDKEQADTLLFFVAKDNRAARGGPAMVQFVSKGQDFFACLSGIISVDNNPALIDKLWTKQAESWFPGGRNDPNLTLIRFDIDDAELWESDISLVGQFKMLFGGKIRPEDEGSHAHITSTRV